MINGLETYEADFREAVMRGVNTGKYNPRLPQASFIAIFNGFRRGIPQLKPGVGVRSDVYDFFTRIFIQVLWDLKEPVNMESEIVQRHLTEGQVKKGSWVTKSVLASAARHENRLTKTIPNGD